MPRRVESSGLWKDGGAIKPLLELSCLRISVIQSAVEWRVGDERIPVQQIGRDFDETGAARFATERELETAVRQRRGLERICWHDLQEH